MEDASSTCTPTRSVPPTPGRRLTSERIPVGRGRRARSDLPEYPAAERPAGRHPGRRTAVITKTKRIKELPHPLYNPRVRTTNTHPDIIDAIGVVRALR